MIEGVKVKNLVVHKDIPDVDQPNVEPGILMEIVRADENLFEKFGQSTMTVAHPGTIKGFHYHENQEDLWFAATGKAVIVLHDMRSDSPTHKQTDVISAGRDNYKLVVIPVGVAHGYKVISEDSVIMFYHTTEPYNRSNPDEKVIPYDDPKIGFDWSKYE
ncbi:MAG: dTDP-4-dehydrorhamnose 3,5-epimerase family protein [Candidatus Doudnabacteria bacterium]|nr:dTDP-4-dehydrorhamnose 3,5-epimerase family protein [Candidatus Doudnabacteria bacterium]